MLEARSLKKVEVPSTLIEYPSPANLHSNRLALHVSEDGTSCWVYVASGCQIYRILVSLKDSLVNEGKDSLLIPEHTQVVDSAIVNRCPHRSEIQTVVLNETESNDRLILGSVDSYGHLIVSRLDSDSKDVERLTFSVSPRDFGVGEGGWAGLCFSPSQWSTTAVAHSFGKSIDVYDQDLHLRTFRTLWYPTAVNFIQNLYGGNESSMLAVTEGCQITGISFSSIDPNYAYIQGVDYEVFCGQWKESKKAFSFRGDSNWLGFSKCANRDVLGGWCDSGSIFVADVVEGKDR
ncbi:uncharacterized protein LOC112511603 isoform X2 [Cynara cardunculus var. scolymus]|uniref:uncharacterized protein LOC112511603 isoform X2 n=1 Tax=Cynara cardunculus var. scolymus TaxID=59895 RepID=UPI000D62A804|nr:uncharacterized protein LOC112511603 isoform X2 [Cynara cardunculus var. scolymus]